MAGIPITGTFSRGANDTGQFAINKASNLLIPIQIVADIAARDALPEYLRLGYMLTYVVSEAKTYRLGGNVTIAGQVWTEESGAFVPLTQKGAANGVVPLDANSKIPNQYLNQLVLSQVHAVADITEMLDLVAFEGNLVIVADASADPAVISGSAVYVKLNDTAPTTTLADFLIVEFGASVTSVNGQTGVTSIDFTSMISETGSQAAFDLAVAANASILANAAAILNNANDISTLDTNKADVTDVLTRTNTDVYTPTLDYNPATKLYVDDAVSGLSADPAGLDTEVQFNNGGTFGTDAGFTYATSVLTIPSLVLSIAPDNDNALTNILVRAGDGTIKYRTAASIIDTNYWKTSGTTTLIGSPVLSGYTSIFFDTEELITTNNNILWGAGAGSITANTEGNVIIGLGAAELGTVEGGNVISGYWAARNATLGDGNVILSTLAASNMAGSAATNFNVIIGTLTAQFAGDINRSVIIGAEAGKNMGDTVALGNNTAVGRWALNDSQGANNSAFGAYAGYNNTLQLTGTGNLFLGNNTGYSDGTISNTIVIASTWAGANASNKVYLGSATQNVIFNGALTENLTETQIAVINSTTGELEYRPSSSIDNSAGLLEEVQVSDGAGGLSSTSGFYYDISKRMLVAAMDNSEPHDFTLAHPDSGKWSAIFGEKHTFLAGRAVNLLVAGWYHTIGDNAKSAFSGAGAFVTGGYNHAGHLFTQAQGYGVKAMGYGAIAMGTGYDFGGSGSMGDNAADAWLVADGYKSVNISSIDATHVVGEGAFGDYSVILGGLNHDIPATSNRSAIIAGNRILAPIGVIDTVFLPKVRLGLGTGGALPTTGETHGLGYDEVTGEVIKIAILDGAKFLAVNSTPGTLPVATGTDAIALGLNAVADGEKNIVIGFDAAANITHSGFTWGWSTVIGDDAARNLTILGNTGEDVFIGTWAGKDASTNGYNTVIGGSAAEFATMNQANVIIGWAAARTATLDNSTIAIGLQAAMNYQGNYQVGAGGSEQNTFIGPGAASQGNRTYKAVFIGAQAGNNAGDPTTDVSDLVAVGAWSGNRFVGADNIALGGHAAYNATTNLTGNSNIFIGANSGYSDGSISNTTVIAPNLSASLSNRVYLGNATQEVIITSGVVTDLSGNDLFWKTTGTTTLAGNTVIDSTSHNLAIGYYDETLDEAGISIDQVNIAVNVGYGVDILSDPTPTNSIEYGMRATPSALTFYEGGVAVNYWKTSGTTTTTGTTTISSTEARWQVTGDGSTLDMEFSANNLPNQGTYQYQNSNVWSAVHYATGTVNPAGFVLDNTGSAYVYTNRLSGKAGIRVDGLQGTGVTVGNGSVANEAYIELVNVDSTATYGGILYLDHDGAGSYAGSFGAGFKFYDARATPVGLEYAENYTANFGARSLIDKGYADTHIGGQNADALITTPTVAEDGKVIAWNNTNQEYELITAGGGGGWALTGTTTLTGNVVIESPDGSSITMQSSADAGYNANYITLQDTLTDIWFETTTGEGAELTVRANPTLQRSILYVVQTSPIARQGVIEVEGHSTPYIKTTISVLSGANTSSFVIDDSAAETMLITDAISDKGLVYASATYRNNFTDLSLIDKGFADGAYLLANTTTTLTADTSVNGSNLYDFNLTLMDRINMTAASQISLSTTGGGVTLLFQDTTDRADFTDNRVGVNQKGLEYGADYSTNYTARSLIDKGYADGHLFGQVATFNTGNILFTDTGQSGRSYSFIANDGDEEVAVLINQTRVQIGYKDGLTTFPNTRYSFGNSVFHVERPDTTTNAAKQELRFDSSGFTIKDQNNTTNLFVQGGGGTQSHIVLFGGLPASMGLNAERTLYFHDAVAPTTDPTTGGGSLYSEAGVLKWRSVASGVVDLTAGGGGGGLANTTTNFSSQTDFGTTSDGRLRFETATADFTVGDIYMYNVGAGSLGGANERAYLGLLSRTTGEAGNKDHVVARYDSGTTNGSYAELEVGPTDTVNVYAAKMIAFGDVTNDITSQVEVSNLGQVTLTAQNAGTGFPKAQILLDETGTAGGTPLTQIISSVNTSTGNVRVLEIERISASVAGAAGIAGSFAIITENSISQRKAVLEVEATMTNVGFGTEESTVDFHGISAGAATTFMSLAKEGITLGSTAQKIQTVHLQMSQLQLQAGATTPLELVAAPASGQYIQVMGASAYYAHNGTSYTAASQLRLIVGTDVIYSTATAFLASATSLNKLLVVNGSTVSSVPTIPMATSLRVATNADAVGAGGTVDVYVQYVIIDTN